VDGIDARRWATNERILVLFWPRTQPATPLLAPPQP
jgi:hypothetical protein